MESTTVVIILKNGTISAFKDEEDWSAWTCKILDKVVLIYRTAKGPDGKRKVVQSRIFNLDVVSDVAVTDIVDTSESVRDTDGVDLLKENLNGTTAQRPRN